MKAILNARRPCCGKSVRIRQDVPLGVVYNVKCKCHPEGQNVIVTVDEEGLRRFQWENSNGSG